MQNIYEAALTNDVLKHEMDETIQMLMITVGSQQSKFIPKINEITFAAFTSRIKLDIRRDFVPPIVFFPSFVNSLSTSVPALLFAIFVAIVNLRECEKLTLKILVYITSITVFITESKYIWED